MSIKFRGATAVFLSSLNGDDDQKPNLEYWEFGFTAEFVSPVDNQLYLLDVEIDPSIYLPSDSIPVMNAIGKFKMPLTLELSIENEIVFERTPVMATIMLMDIYTGSLSDYGAFKTVINIDLTKSLPGLSSLLAANNIMMACLQTESWPKISSTKAKKK